MALFLSGVACIGKTALLQKLTCNYPTYNMDLYERIKRDSSLFKDKSKDFSLQVSFLFLLC